MKNSVFVIGAGASAEVDLPTGEALKDTIQGLLNLRFEIGNQLKSGDPTIADALRTVVRERSLAQAGSNALFHAARRIKDALPLALSIDNFVDAHKDDKNVELCGKLAIVRAILEAEKGSKLYTRRRNGNDHIDFKATEKTWFGNFFKLLTENCGPNDLPERLRSVSLVIFNYDRCVEHFLYNAITTYYSLSGEAAAELLGQLKIYHPYGSVGFLPWQRSNSAMAIAFGEEPSTQTLLRLAGQIKTFTEGTDESASEITETRSALRETERLVFLGFAFHPLNLKLLWPTEVSGTTGRKCFATGKGISTSNAELIATHICNFGGFGGGDIQIRPMNCSDLLNEYSRSLTSW